MDMAEVDRPTLAVADVGGLAELAQALPERGLRVGVAAAAVVGGREEQVARRRRVVVAQCASQPGARPLLLGPDDLDDL